LAVQISKKKKKAADGVDYHRNKVFYHEVKKTETVFYDHGEAG